MSDAPEQPEWLSLDEGETVEWVGQPAAVSLVPAVLVGVPLILAFGIGLLVILGAYLTVANTDFVVTSTTLYHRRGVLSTNIESVGLDRIQNTEYSQSLSGKQLGYGTIEISTAGSSGADVTFRSIENPREVRDLVAGLTSSGGGSGGTGGRSEPAEEGSGAGVDPALLSELATELRAVNESMAAVEQRVREERGGTGGGASDGRDVASAEPSERPGGGDTAQEEPPEPEADSDDGAGTAAEFVADDDEDDPPPTPFGGDGE
jgi:membrane protein YdbS with pleckstrin-like domain